MTTTNNALNKTEKLIASLYGKLVALQFLQQEWRKFQAQHSSEIELVLADKSIFSENRFKVECTDRMVRVSDTITGEEKFALPTSTCLKLGIPAFHQIPLAAANAMMHIVTKLNSQEISDTTLAMSPIPEDDESLVNFVAALKAEAEKNKQGKSCGHKIDIYVSILDREIITKIIDPSKQITKLSFPLSHAEDARQFCLGLLKRFRDAEERKDQAQQLVDKKSGSKSATQKLEKAQKEYEAIVWLLRQLEIIEDYTSDAGSLFLGLTRKESNKNSPLSEAIKDMNRVAHRQFLHDNEMEIIREVQQRLMDRHLIESLISKVEVTGEDDLIYSADDFADRVIELIRAT
jgi:hypothetical protein